MFPLPPLPYPYDALSPVISERTLRLHHDKHQGAYVDKLNALVKSSGDSDISLEDVIVEAAKEASRKKLFNNAAQAWNHAFFWNSMSTERQKPAEGLQSAINSAFGSLQKLREAFVTAGVEHFGSGWVWLAAEGGALKVLSTHDAGDTLTAKDLTPLLVCDLWEHAYYLDYQNDRKAFLEAWFDALPNWRFAATQMAAAQGHGAPWRYPAPVATAAAA